jgi:hypothetical protein
MAKNKLVVTAGVARPAASKYAAAIGNAFHGRAEGHAVDLEPIGQAHDGANRFKLDVTQAPVPQRRYSADTAFVVYGGTDVKFVFAQTCLFGDGFESALAVRVNPQAFADLVSSLRVAKAAELSRVADVLKIKPEGLTEVKTRPVHTVNVVANVFGFAIAGHETCIDFYHANAFAIGKSEGATKLEVEPVVRVDLRTSLFMSLVSKAEDILAQVANVDGKGE